jgi:hypothetical protein
MNVARPYSGCQKNVPVFKRFFSTTPYAAIPSLGVFKPGAVHARPRLHPHRLRHCRAFVFSRRWRKNPSHPLCVWSVTRNIIMESGVKSVFIDLLPTPDIIFKGVKD